MGPQQNVPTVPILGHVEGDAWRSDAIHGSFHRIGGPQRRPQMLSSLTVGTLSSGTSILGNPHVGAGDGNYRLVHLGCSAMSEACFALEVEVGRSAGSQ